MTDHRTDFKKMRCSELRTGMDVKAKGHQLAGGAVRATKIERTGD